MNHLGYSLILLTTLVSLISAATIINQHPNCHCHHGYLPKTNQKDMKQYCHGILHDGRRACVNLERPRCKCTLSQGFIVQDLYGYWCVKVKPGYAEEIRWDCENKRDWDEFFASYPDEKPVPNSDL
ncbi:unnamed protein product [Phyllotreta striolata]|uniref:Secreted protein n=1 Tax=Phyllotreta striolata TaxID=444603 RepID=A0A9N9TL61_PHYSR|nr:unnamed protein product [Phyllotreta striolata]